MRGLHLALRAGASMARSRATGQASPARMAGRTSGALHRGILSARALSAAARPDGAGARFEGVSGGAPLAAIAGALGAMAAICGAGSSDASRAECAPAGAGAGAGAGGLALAARYGDVRRGIEGGGIHNSLYAHTLKTPAPNHSTRLVCCCCNQSNPSVCRVNTAYITPTISRPNR